MTLTLAHYLVLGAILFTIGIFGFFLNRRNLIILLMSVELMLLAANINFVAFSTWFGDAAGQVFVFFVLTVAAAEAAIGLAILVLLFRNLNTINVEELDQLKAGWDCDNYEFTKSLPVDRPGAPGRRHPGRAVRHGLPGQLRVAPGIPRDHHCAGGGVLRRLRAHVVPDAGRTHLRRHPVHLDRYRRHTATAGLPDRQSVGPDDGGRDRRVPDGTYLHHRLHGRRSRLPAFLRLHLAVHLLHAHAGDGEQHGAAVLRLGSRRPRVLPVDRLLVQPFHGYLRQHDGVPDHPCR